jgi:hypothetical protein
MEPFGRCRAEEIIPENTIANKITIRKSTIRK